MRTQGKAHHDGNRVLFVENGKTSLMLTVEGKRFDGTGSTSDTAHTAAIANNTANSIDAMGYDGDKLIEMLPDLIGELFLAIEKDEDSNALANFMQAISEKPHDT